jgi:hypothetical protein
MKTTRTTRSARARTPTTRSAGPAARARTPTTRSARGARGGAFDAPAPAFGEQRRFEQPQSAFDQPQSAFDQPQSAFDQPSSAFDQPPSAFAAAAPPGAGFGDDSDDSDDSDPFGDATP